MQSSLNVKVDILIPLNRYRGIGIRIEDDVLITENGPDVLTAECPKEVEDIERPMNGTEAARL